MGVPLAEISKSVEAAHAALQRAREALDAAQDEYAEVLSDYLCTEMEALGGGIPEGWEWDTSEDYDMGDEGPTIRLTDPGLVHWESGKRVYPRWDLLEKRVVYEIGDAGDFELKIPLPPKFHLLLEALTAAD